MFFWFKREVDGFVGDTLWGKQMKIHASGLRCLEIQGDVSDPTLEIPTIPEKFIAKVTSRERILRNFCREGIYEYEGVTLMVRNDFSHGHHVQEIRMHGPSLKSLKAIYTLVRQDKLTPTENWGESWEEEKPKEIMALTDGAGI